MIPAALRGFGSFFPLSICLFTYVPYFFRYYVRTFEQSLRFSFASTSIWSKALRFRVFLVLND